MGPRAGWRRPLAYKRHRRNLREGMNEIITRLPFTSYCSSFQLFLLPPQVSLSGTQIFYLLELTSTKSSYLLASLL
jgi:hypothetical protein